MTSIEKLKRWGVLVLAAVYQVALVIFFSVASESPAWRESLWIVKILVFAGIFMATFLIGGYFLRLIDKQLVERDAMIRELERSSNIEEEANEEIISINQMVNEQVIKLTQMSDELESSYVNTVSTLARALDSRDRYTHGHSERVAYWSLLIAERIGYSPDELERIRQASLLHDIGKIGVQDSILRKPGPLTPEELKEMQKHPVFGYEIIKDVKFLAPCLDGILYHHERIDGKGYPKGLTGEDIPLDARIIAVADTFDAMTSDRPYRKGMKQEKALAIMTEVSGRQLDVEMMKAFAGIVKEAKNSEPSRTAVSAFGR
ncbi:HD-GYP domain-containing protein [bacterium]|nr:HD-GYP domain-containing protein [bacterium]